MRTILIREFLLGVSLKSIQTTECSPAAFHVPRQRAPAMLGRILHCQFLDHLRRLDAGQPLVEALVAVRESFVIEAQQVQHRGVEIADVHRVFDDVV